MSCLPAGMAMHRREPNAGETNWAAGMCGRGTGVIWKSVCSSLPWISNAFPGVAGQKQVKRTRRGCSWGIYHHHQRSVVSTPQATHQVQLTCVGRVFPWLFLVCGCPSTSQHGVDLAVRSSAWVTHPACGNGQDWTWDPPGPPGMKDGVRDKALRKEGQGQKPTFTRLTAQSHLFPFIGSSSLPNSNFISS